MDYHFTESQKQAINILTMLMVYADGKVHPRELQYSFTVYKKIGIDETIINFMHTSSPDEAMRTVREMTSSQREFVAAFLTSVAAVDGEIANEERDYLNNFSLICNLPHLSHDSALNIVEKVF